MTAQQRPHTRIPLSRERVFEAAISVADNGGLEALTMRALATELDVEAMSLYYHVKNKEAILDGVVEALVTEIEDECGGFEPHAGTGDWKAALRTRILHARTVMLRHKWAPALIETRTTIGLGTMRYMHGIIAILRAGGFSWDLIHHTMHALGSRALGFSPELFEPGAPQDQADLGELMDLAASEVPLLVEMLSNIAHDDPDSTIGWCDDQTEFLFGVDVLLDGLEHRLEAERGS
ncbi:MAG: TetR/AcrR family transcriptional regulator C-terminal domain-containing protein [Acidimicrobiia bacterium]|nr:TetR/AcrR family transcriptional regulator C-terminal domain-containing protein [Acidimicrobiia bacterium]